MITSTYENYIFSLHLKWMKSGETPLQELPTTVCTSLEPVMLQAKTLLRDSIRLLTHEFLLAF